MSKIEELLGMQAGEFRDVLISLGTRIAIAAVIIIVGFWLARRAAKIMVNLLRKKDADKSLISFLTSLVSALIKVLAIITAINQLGVEMTSFVAILGAVGLAVGMAFSGTLSNFAGGVMILFFKPFKVGDYINAQGEEGIVDEIIIFNTILKTLDNKTIILANGPLANGTITNFTKQKKRRVDWTFGIAYGDDVKIARDLLARLMNEDTRIISDPEAPFVGVGELADSSVNLTVRAWTKTEDYWGVFFEMNERVYAEFESAGLNIPFPQMDVHVQNS